MTATRSTTSTMNQPAAAVWTVWRDRLRAFIGRRVGNPHDVDDLMQEVALRVLRHAERLVDLEQPAAWLYRVARHVIIDHQRHRGTTAATIQPLPDDEPADAVDDDGVIDDALAQAATWLQPFVQALGDEHREVIQRVDLDGEDRTAVARDLGLTMPALKARLRRGRQALRTLIERCCELVLDARGEPMDFHKRPDGWSPNDDPERRGDADDPGTGCGTGDGACGCE